MQYGKILLASNCLSNHSFDRFYSALYSYYFLLRPTEDKSQKSNQVSFIVHFKWVIHDKEIEFQKCGTPSNRILFA